MRINLKRKDTFAFIFATVLASPISTARARTEQHPWRLPPVDGQAPTIVAVSNNADWTRDHSPAASFTSLEAETQAVPDFDVSPDAAQPQELVDSPPAMMGDETMVQDISRWQVMPLGLLYRSYLAGAKEPRFSSYWNSDSTQGDIWDASIGGRLGLLRYGTCDPIHPEGWQIDLEGAAQARLEPNSDSTMLYSVDFRIGIPVTWARGPWQFKTGYYHISSHLGDEFLILYPGSRRLNYTRDALQLGVGYFCTEKLRLYGEAAYALSAMDGAEPWEFQCGADWAPAGDTGLWGAPFAAVNGHIREDVDFGGNVVLQAGWCWRQFPRGSLFRIGVQYFRGKSDQYEYYDRSEERFGWGMWADF